MQSGELPYLRSVWLGALLLVVSLVLSVESLRHLRQYYALEIEVKMDHRVIASGPYRFVRHPIYISDLLGYIGVCLLASTWFTWVALPLFVIALQMMIRREEQILISVLGDEYLIYKQSTRTGLIPRPPFLRAGTKRDDQS